MPVSGYFGRNLLCARPGMNNPLYPYRTVLLVLVAGLACGVIGALLPNDEVSGAWLATLGIALDALAIIVLCRLAGEHHRAVQELSDVIQAKLWRATPSEGSVGSHLLVRADGKVYQVRQESTPADRHGDRLVPIRSSVHARLQ